MTDPVAHQQLLAARVCVASCSSSLQGIEHRDGFPVSPETIFCCDGASAAVHLLMRTLLRGIDDAMLCPIPQCDPS